MVVALLAPVIGVWVDAPRRRRRTLGFLTAGLVLLTSGMSLIRDDLSYLWAGLVLLALAAAFSDLASVPYNAMLRQLATPETSGRISGFGWGAGYVGSMVLLLVVYVGFIAGHGPTTGLLNIPTADGQNVRAAMLMTAAWMAVVRAACAHRAAPGARSRRREPGEDRPARRLPQAVVGHRREWRRDRNVVYYLLASAVFRDGLMGVFTFGGVLAATVYGLSQADVLLFGVTANVVAAVGAIVGGLLDDRIGSKAVILGSLASMIVLGATLMTLSGATAFWVLGLLLCLFVGPTNSSARTLLLRMTAHGKEGVVFGLYTTTGRAVIFLAPLMFSTFVDAFGADRAGMGGLLVVLAAGFVAMLLVRAPAPLARRAADRQQRAGAFLDLHATDADLAGDVATRVDDGDARRVLRGLGQVHFLAPRQQHVELGLHHATAVDVGDVDRAALPADLVESPARFRRRCSGWWSDSEASASVGEWAGSTAAPAWWSSSVGVCGGLCSTAASPESTSPAATDWWRRTPPRRPDRLPPRRRSRRPPTTTAADREAVRAAYRRAEPSRFADRSASSTAAAVPSAPDSTASTRGVAGAERRAAGIRRIRIPRYGLVGSEGPDRAAANRSCPPHGCEGTCGTARGRRSGGTERRSAINTTEIA